MRRIGYLTLFGAILLFTRLYNIENTTRFIWDESSDLVRLHQIYVDRKLTLVGPISEDNSKVFGSLAYYLSLPFAILGKFDPLSPVWGTTLGGIVTAAGLLMLVAKLNRGWAWWVGIIILFWFPILQSSRAGLWAWHVSYIPMWLTLGILLYLKRTKLSLLLAGLFLGLTVHHHYLTIFAVVGFTAGAVVDFIKSKEIGYIFLLCSGLALAVLPFVIFDVRHPPGLFLSKILFSSPIETEKSLVSYGEKLIFLSSQMGDFFQLGALGILVVVLLMWDVFRFNQRLIWAGGWVAQLVGLLFIYNDGVSVHYLLPGAVFFLSMKQAMIRSWPRAVRRSAAGHGALGDPQLAMGRSEF